MNTDQLNSLIRSLLKVAGAALIAHGYAKYADLLNMPEVFGLLSMAAGLLWSHFSHTSDSPGSGKVASVILAFTLGGSLMFGVTGCGTTPLQATYRTMGTTDVTVETALQAYDALAADGITTPEQNAKVKAAYQKYQTAFAALCDAGAVYAAANGTNSPAASEALQQASNDASQDLSDLVALIRSFGAKI